MKKVLIATSLLMFGLNAFANEEINTNVFLVVKSKTTQEFYVERAPVIGCAGLVKGPQLAQLTREYKVNSGLFCTTNPVQENINYLACAVLSDSELTDDGNVTSVTLDISGCADKNDPELINTIKKTVRLNFSRSTTVKIDK